LLQFLNIEGSFDIVRRIENGHAFHSHPMSVGRQKIAKPLLNGLFGVGYLAHTATKLHQLWGFTKQNEEKVAPRGVIRLLL
jgi:hypothetical protein